MTKLEALSFSSNRCYLPKAIPKERGNLVHVSPADHYVTVKAVVKAQGLILMPNNYSKPLTEDCMVLEKKSNATGI